MKKKEALTNSFSSPRVKKTKTTLSPEVIEQIVESREAEKTKINNTEPTEKKIETPKTSIPQQIQQPIIETTVQEPKAKVIEQKTTRITAPKKASNNRTRRTSEEKQGIEREIKTSFDIPENIYDDMRIYLIRQKKSMREYLLDLILKDLSKNNKH